jgi:endonuclease G
MTVPFNKILITVVLVVISFSGMTYSQTNDTITIHHKYYTTTFSKSKRFPVVVKYWLTKKMLDCNHRFKRKNKFKADPLIPEYTDLDNDYKHSDYDRGHKMDAFDCGCDSTAMVESFYYSNVAPQVPTLNRGNWKRLEDYTRKLVKVYDSVLVWCGSVTIEFKHIGRVTIPDYCWKVIYIRKIGIVKACSFRNDIVTNGKIHYFEVSTDSIRNLSGFCFPVSSIPRSYLVS